MVQPTLAIWRAERDGDNSEQQLDKSHLVLVTVQYNKLE